MFSATILMIILNGLGVYFAHQAELMFNVSLRVIIVAHIVTIYFLLKGVFIL